MFKSSSYDLFSSNYANELLGSYVTCIFTMYYYMSLCNITFSTSLKLLHGFAFVWRVPRHPSGFIKNVKIKIPWLSLLIFQGNIFIFHDLNYTILYTLSWLACAYGFGLSSSDSNQKITLWYWPWIWPSFSQKFELNIM